jgi:hypothetical protein
MNYFPSQKQSKGRQVAKSISANGESLTPRQYIDMHLASDSLNMG